LLDDRVRGKTVLDVGTYYGYFMYEAIRRGAVDATGVEADPERYAIAKRIADLHGNAYNIVHGRAEDLIFDGRFDIVLFLNVLHHVIDPIKVIYRLASLCRETLILEFCLADDPNYLCFLYSDLRAPTRLDQARAYLRSWMMRCVAGGLPLIAVGNREYHRVFYFSREAFYNLFVIHHKLFDKVDFLKSSTNVRRTVAICRLAENKVSTVK
jgi:SAM-dependent methyltransferase